MINKSAKVHLAAVAKQVSGSNYHAYKVDETPDESKTRFHISYVLSLPKEKRITRTGPHESNGHFRLFST